MKFLPPLLGFWLCCHLQISAQQLINGDFQTSCDTSATGLCGWGLSWGGKETCSPASDGNNQWMLIKGKQEISVGFTEQTIQLNLSGLSLIKISGRIKTDSVSGKGAGLNIGIYDNEGFMLTNKDMGYAAASWVKGNSTWKKYQLAVVCPQNAATIKIGAILYGKGSASFDDFTFIIENVEGKQHSTFANTYITAACDSIAKHSLVKDSIDIRQLKSTALQIAGNATTPEDCFPAVEYIISSLRNYGDYHSFFMTKHEVDSWANDSSENAGIEYPAYRIINECGYLFIPHFNGGNETLMRAFADTIQYGIQKLSGMHIKGWIVDLRRNTGGNMEPMITGLGPLFSDEKLGSLVDVYGSSESWFYKNGTYSWDSDYTGITATNPVKLDQQLPIAVLTSNQTGSSGEIVTISFIGNKNTRSFGQPTWGLTTGNGSFDMPDGSRIMLASTHMADRNGKIYEGSVVPDQITDDGDLSKGDISLHEAIEWIMSQK